MKPSSHLPRKRFGQHFLTDPGILSRIVTSCYLRRDDLVLEIGPGLGALTEHLLQRIDKLQVVELDRDLAATLTRRWPPEKLTVHQMDILDCRLADLRDPGDDRPFRVVGNLPYNISTPLIFHLLEQIEEIKDMVFMVQTEVALRLAAGAGSRNYGRLSVMTALRLDAECLFDVPPDAFDPPPRVNSTVIRLTPKPSITSNAELETVAAIVSAAFAQRRKTLRNALSRLMDGTLIEAAGIDPGARAETVTPEAYVELAKRYLAQNRSNL